MYAVTRHTDSQPYATPWSSVPAQHCCYCCCNRDVHLQSAQAAMRAAGQCTAQPDDIQVGTRATQRPRHGPGQLLTVRAPKALASATPWRATPPLQATCAAQLQLLCIQGQPHASPGQQECAFTMVAVTTARLPRTSAHPVTLRVHTCRALRLLSLGELQRHRCRQQHRCRQRHSIEAVARIATQRAAAAQIAGVRPKSWGERGVKRV